MAGKLPENYDEALTFIQKLQTEISELKYSRQTVD